MGAKEIDLQRKIIEAACRQGGWGSKWATQIQAGKPDLILSLPSMGLFAAEVKRISSFGQKLKVTELQRENLRRIVRAEGLALLLVVLDRGSRDRHLIACPWCALYATKKDAIRIMPHGGHVDLKGLIIKFLEVNYGGTHACRFSEETGRYHGGGVRPLSIRSPEGGAHG